MIAQGGRTIYWQNKQLYLDGNYVRQEEKINNQHVFSDNASDNKGTVSM